MINLLHHQMSKQWKKMDSITSCMDAMPQLVKSIENAMNDMGNYNDTEYYYQGSIYSIYLFL